VGGSDRTARLWDLSHPECPQLPQVFHHDDEVFGVAFSSDGQKLATASGDGTFAVWNVDKSLKPLRKFEIGKAVFSVAFSPVSNALIAASGDDGTYGVWNIENGNQIQQFPALTGQLGQIAFSPDGRFVATGGTDGTAIVADVSSGHIDKLDADQPLFGLAFSPDSQYLLTGSLDGTARLWIIGKNDVLPASRRGTLLTLGLGRLGPDINLTMAECLAIREMHIQILDLIERDWPEAEKNTICAIPALVSY
jgi:WD40 repeat protein